MAEKLEDGGNISPAAVFAGKSLFLEEDYVASVARQMALSSLEEDDISSFWNARVSPRLSAFLYVEVLRKKQSEKWDLERRQQLKNHLVYAKAAAFARQQIQAEQAQLYKLKQQQLVKQQQSSIWCRQNREAIRLQQQQQSSRSTGTGVFLPRSVSSSTTAKKPACSAVLLPVHDNETASARVEPCHDERKVSVFRPPAATISGREIRLPNEWTY